MNTYFFGCSKCGKEYEIELLMSEYSDKKDKQKCPDCGEKLERVFKPIGTPIYACGGFYCTDKK